MAAQKKRTSPFTDTNGLVAAFLDDVVDRPVPRGAGPRLAEIRDAVAKGEATVEMALEIIDLFPSQAPGRALDRRKRSDGAGAGTEKRRNGSMHRRARSQSDALDTESLGAGARVD